MISGLCLIVLDQNDLYLTFKFKMVTANRQIKVFFMHVNYKNHKQHLFNGNPKNRLRIFTVD